MGVSGAHRCVEVYVPWREVEPETQRRSKGMKAASCVFLFVDFAHPWNSWSSPSLIN